MELIAVHVVSHKSVQDQWLPVEPMTVFFGRNGVGKSNILEAIFDGMFGISEHRYTRWVEEGGADERWMETEFVASLPDAWTAGHPDELLFRRFVAGLAGAAPSTGDGEADTERTEHLLGPFFSTLTAELPDEVARAVRTMLDAAIKEPVLVFFHDGSARLCILPDVHRAHRSALAELLSRSTVPLPLWVESLARDVGPDEVAILRNDQGRVDPEPPWHYPPLGPAGPADDLNSLAAARAFRLYFTFKDEAMDETKWTVPVDLPPRPISFSSLRTGEDEVDSLVLPPNRGTATVEAGWLAVLHALEVHANSLLPPFCRENGLLRLYPRPDQFDSH